MPHIRYLLWDGFGFLHTGTPGRDALFAKSLHPIQILVNIKKISNAQATDFQTQPASLASRRTIVAKN
jgi:hypothetical protein